MLLQTVRNQLKDSGGSNVFQNKNINNPIKLYINDVYGAIEDIPTNILFFLNGSEEWDNYMDKHFLEPTITTAGVPNNRVFEWTSLRSGQTDYIALGNKINYKFTIDIPLINFDGGNYNRISDKLVYLNYLFRTKIIRVENEELNDTFNTTHLVVHSYDYGTNKNANYRLLSLNTTQFYE